MRQPQPEEQLATSTTRRGFITQAGGLLLLSGLGGLAACQSQEPLLRVAANNWPGYEFIFLARELGALNPDNIRLVEMPSSTATLQVLAGNTVEAACLTLDEVLTAIADGLDLVVIAVLDVSLGADVLLAQPHLADLRQLKGKRIGVEQTALGAVMLEAALQKAGLTAVDVDIVSLTLDLHAKSFSGHKVDALITFEPVTSQLLGRGAKILFSSAEIPGRIVDVLCVQRKVLDRNPKCLHKLVAGHFHAREKYLRNPAAYAEFFTKRMQLTDAAQVAASFNGLELTDLAQNHAWFNSPAQNLEKRAEELMQIMVRAKLLPRTISISKLADGRFLPSLEQK